MKKNVVFLLVLAGMLLLGGCGRTAEEKEKDAEIMEVVPGYVVDVDDPRELAGIVDYVFVASLTDTGEVKDISDELELPCTVYEAEVLENLKGSLQTDEPILLDKEGGYSQSEGVIYQYQEDYMPESGDVCLIYAFARDDGTLVASAKNSSIKISDSKEEDYTESKEYQAAIEGVSNQIISEHYSPGLSVYDTNYENGEDEVSMDQEKDKVSIVFDSMENIEKKDGEIVITGMEFKVENISEERMNFKDVCLAAYDKELNLLEISSDNDSAALDIGERSGMYSYSIEGEAAFVKILGYEYIEDGEVYSDTFDRTAVYRNNSHKIIDAEEYTDDEILRMKF